MAQASVFRKAILFQVPAPLRFLCRSLRFAVHLARAILPGCRTAEARSFADAMHGTLVADERTCLRGRIARWEDTRTR